MKYINSIYICFVCLFFIPLSSCKHDDKKDLEDIDMMEQQNVFIEIDDKIERLLPMEGAYNARDLGGYKTINGKKVKWGKVFRSGDLHKLTSEDLTYLSEIPLKTFIDFRDASEISAAPDKKPESVVRTFSLPIISGDLDNDIKKLTPELTPTLLIDVNKSLVRDWQPAYKEFFNILMENKNAPLLFHCSAGKDRTGYAAALFLSALGVDRETIIRDYMLSDEFLKGKYDSIISAYPVLAPLMTVKREYLEAALNLIDKEYGGMDNYLTKNLGVDLKKMREIYTE